MTNLDIGYSFEFRKIWKVALNHVGGLMRKSFVDGFTTRELPEFCMWKRLVKALAISDDKRCFVQYAVVLPGCHFR